MGDQRSNVMYILYICPIPHEPPGHVVQLVMYLAADTCLTADPGIWSLSHTLVEINHEIISTVILLPSTDSRRVVVSYKRKYVHKVLVNC